MVFTRSPRRRVAFSEIHYSTHYYPRASFSLPSDELLSPFLCSRLRGYVQIAILYERAGRFLPSSTSAWAFSIRGGVKACRYAHGRVVRAYTHAAYTRSPAQLI